MTTYASYRSPRETCYAVQGITQSQFDKSVARPWNMYEPDTTMWWLVPSSDWPAYKHGKLYFNWADDERKQIWVGFHSEKGLGAIISSVYSSAKGSRFIMDKDWHWFNLFHNLENGQFAQTVMSIAPQLPAPIQIRIKGGYVEDPTDFDPYAPHFKQDEYLLQWNTALSEFDVILSKPEGHVLGELAQVNSFERLARELKLLTSNAWVWVNLYFVLPFTVRNAQEHNEDTVWGATEIWSNFLRHFRRFLL